LTKEDKKLFKIFNSTEDEKVKAALASLFEDNEESEEEVIVKEVVKEVEVEEVIEVVKPVITKEPSFTKTDVEAMIAAALSGVVMKSEIEEVTKDLKKAKGFGVEAKVTKADEDKDLKTNDEWLRKINTQYQ